MSEQRSAWLQALGWLATGAGLALAVPAHAAESRSCTAAERREADRWLWLNERDKQLSVRTHLPWGAPVSQQPHDHELLLVQRDYVNLYDAALRVALWSAEKLNPARIGKVKQRANCFRRDPRLTNEQASLPSDYKEPIYDQGHLTPDADQDSSLTAALNTYVMSNMAPENCQFNRGIWQILEGITRKWARENGTIYVLNGSVFDRDGDGERDADDTADRMVSNNGKQRVAIPSAMYRIIARKRDDGGIDTLSILLPHTTANPQGPAALAYLQARITTVEQLEALTGLDFFPEAAALDEATTLWPFQGAPPRSLCQQ